MRLPWRGWVRDRLSLVTSPLLRPSLHSGHPQGACNGNLWILSRTRWGCGEGELAQERSAVDGGAGQHVVQGGAEQGSGLRVPYQEAL